LSIQHEIKQNKPFSAVSQEAAVSLIRTADLIRRVVADVVEPRGITPQQYNVLRILRGAGPKGLPTLDIAGRMVEQTPGITRLVDRLQIKKLVRRERCKTDRRQVFCRITDSGLALLASLDEPLREAEKQALGALSSLQLAQLVALLDLTRNGLHAALESRRPESTQEAS
jgi:DNA-binding MarR family transcriptional regulator